MIQDPDSSPVGIPPKTEPEAVLPSPRDTPVYLVDDDPEVLQSLQTFLADDGYRVRGFTDPVQAQAAIAESPPHLMIIDRNMAGLGELDLARVALEEDPDIALVVLTGARDVELAVEAFRLGVSDYLLKPLDFREIERTLRRVLIRRSQAIFHRESEARMRLDVEDRTRKLERNQQLLEGVTVGALTALVELLEQRTPHFRGHSQGVAGVAERIARELGLPRNEIRACKTAGFLHDIGMIAVPDAILEKPTALTEEETARVEEHCRIGKELLEPFIHLGPIPIYVYLHHERVDGSGYPNGLVGQEIPLGAQVVAAADSYRALVEPRPFREANTSREAVEILMGTAGIWFSEHILEALVRVVPANLSA